MSGPQRVVIDTSTLIGAMLRPDSVPRQALLNALRTCELAACVATLDELREVLQRPKFDRYLPLQARLDFLGLVSRHAQLVEVDAASEQAASGACRDAKDAKFLALALACHAVALTLGTPICSPCIPARRAHFDARRVFADRGRVRRHQ